jgi:hypothetical protein
VRATVSAKGLLALATCVCLLVGGGKMLLTAIAFFGMAVFAVSVMLWLAFDVAGLVFAAWLRRNTIQLDLPCHMRGTGPQDAIVERWAADTGLRLIWLRGAIVFPLLLVRHGHHAYITNTSISFVQSSDAMLFKAAFL